LEQGGVPFDSMLPPEIARCSYPIKTGGALQGEKRQQNVSKVREKVGPNEDESQTQSELIY
jgi:hypothetical protein